MKRGDVMSYQRQAIETVTIFMLTYIRYLKKVLGELDKPLIHRLQSLINESLNVRIWEVKWAFRCLIWC